LLYLSVVNDTLKLPFNRWRPFLTVIGGLVGATAERAALDSSAALTGAAAAASGGIAAAKRGRLPSRVWLPTGDGPGLAMSRYTCSTAYRLLTLLLQVLER
jgi:hypothetical protein